PDRILAAGNDFYSSPRLSPDGSQLAWVTWNHPNMPWDDTELWLADVAADGEVESPRRIAGGGEESVCQPQWSPDGTLYFISDRTGWWNIYRYDDGESHPVCPRDGEFARPQWILGASSYAFESPTRIVCAFSERGIGQLAWLTPSS